MPPRWPHRRKHEKKITQAIFLLGMVEIGLDIGGNTLLMWLHGERVSPYMNALHFFFGVGAFLAPLILAQMLLLNDGPAGVRWTYWLLALLMLPVALLMALTASLKFSNLFAFSAGAEKKRSPLPPD